MFSRIEDDDETPATPKINRRGSLLQSFPNLPPKKNAASPLGSGGLLSLNAIKRGVGAGSKQKGESGLWASKGSLQYAPSVVDGSNHTSSRQNRAPVPSRRVGDGSVSQRKPRRSSLTHVPQRATVHGKLNDVGGGQPKPIRRVVNNGTTKNTTGSVASARSKGAKKAVRRVVTKPASGEGPLRKAAPMHSAPQSGTSPGGSKPRKKYVRSTSTDTPSLPDIDQAIPSVRRKAAMSPKGAKGTVKIPVSPGSRPKPSGAASTNSPQGDSRQALPLTPPHTPSKPLARQGAAPGALSLSPALGAPNVAHLVDRAEEMSIGTKGTEHIVNNAKRRQRRPGRGAGSRRASLQHVPTRTDDQLVAMAEQQYEEMQHPQLTQPPLETRGIDMTSPLQMGRRASMGIVSGDNEPPATAPLASKGTITLDTLESAGRQDNPEVQQARGNRTRLYKFARACDWERVAEECRLFPRDAKCVDAVDGTTALHLAVMSRANPSLRDGDYDDLFPAPIPLIEQLVVACPEAAITRCAAKKYTPLTYACLVLDRDFDMSDSASIVSILLHHAPQSAYVFTDDGFSALDIHILSYSRFHQEKEEHYAVDQASTQVLQTLLIEKPDLAEARSYKNRVRGPIELLYRSNLEEFKGIGTDNAQTREWWAWKWVSLLLKYAPRQGSAMTKSVGPFTALHAAASLIGCPLPILSIASSSNPSQLAEPDPRGGKLGNIPLHEVSSWVCDQETINGDPFVLRRKAMAIQHLLRKYPAGAKMTNNMGETAQQLAIESATPWECGLGALVKAHPESLLVKRKLRESSDENEQLLSVLFGDENESVDSDWVDPAEAVEGMYPFMVAAVIAAVPESKQHSHSSGKDHAEELKKKDLDSLRSIYGLLRAMPKALEMYVPVYRQRGEDSESESGSDYTEVTLDE